MDIINAMLPKQIAKVNITLLYFLYAGLLFILWQFNKVENICPRCGYLRKGWREIIIEKVGYRIAPDYKIIIF